MHAISKILRCESQIPAKETKCLSCFGINFKDVLTPIHVISMLTEHVPRFDCVGNSQNEFVSDALIDIWSH